MQPDRRKDFEKRAAFSEKFFRTMFQVASVGMAITDATERRLLDVNAKLCQITGYERDELIGRYTRDLMHPDDRRSDEDRYRLAIAGVTAQHLSETRCVRKDGTVVWIRINATFLRDEDSQVIRTMAVVEDITDRVQAETAARQSERRLKVFLDGIPDRVRLKDTEGRYLAASLSDAKALGANSVDEIIGKTLLDFRPAAQARQEMEEDQDIMRSGRTLHAEYGRNDGTWFDVIKAPIWDEAGKPAGIVTVARDVTERKRMEEALRETEFRLREFLDGIPSRAWFKDAQGRYLMVNTREAAAQGAAPEGIVGKFAHEVVSAEEAERVLLEDRQVIDNGKTLRLERRSNVDGSWSEIIKAPVRRIDGTVIGMVGISRDISERKQAEQALRESELRQRAFLDAIPDPAWLKGTDGRFVAVNRSYADILGRPADAVIGKSLRELQRLDAAAATQIEAEDNEVLAAPGPMRFERPFKIDSQSRWHEIIKAPIRFADGSVAGIVGIARDITDRRAAEEALRAAKAAAEDANRAKGEFLSHMSHEIRTPMNAILGFAELALLEQPDPNQVDHLTKITAATKSLLRVVDDVLDFERVDAGKLQLESLDFRIGDVLQNVRDLVARTADSKGLALRMKVADDVPPRLRGDPTRIGQVLINLCANAVKFTAHGYVEVLVRREAGAGGEPLLRFAVRDTGIGISDEEQSRLFQPFTQADSSTTRRYGGTGLGLVISRRVIEHMGGRIWIESEPGEGTTVYFTLPCTVSQMPVAAAGAALEQLPPEAAAMVGKRVLIVDDHPINRMLMAKLLKLAGAEGLPAENGLDALRVLAEETRVDLVLMDLRMPEMDGYEATRRIRADARWAKLPIVAVTASAATYERARCMAVGMNDVMIKPIHQAVFFPVVAAAMKQAENKKNV